VSFTTPISVASGVARQVLEVDGHQPARLCDFEGDRTFVIGDGDRYVVRCVGRVVEGMVRFHEKDMDNDGKDIRVWQVRADGARFVAEHISLF
jgi:hypothetical protein